MSKDIKKGITYEEACDAYLESCKDWPNKPPTPDFDQSDELVDGAWELVDNNGDTLAVVSSSGSVGHYERYVFTINTTGEGTSPEEAWADACETIASQLYEFLDLDNVPEWQIGG